MLKLKHILLSLAGMAMFLSLNASAQSFSSGENFESISLRGDITVFCPQGGVQVYSCAEEILNPREMDYFVLPQGIDADEVELIRVGKKKTYRQTQKYDVKKGRSSKKFNLWINTLFQTPLLGDGDNEITYIARKNGQVLKSGTIKVSVYEKPNRRCPHRTYSGAFESDCQSGFNICPRYFRDENYCE